MANLLLSFLGTAAALTFWEFIKRIGVRLVEGYAPSAVATGLAALDRLLPSFIAEGVTSTQMEERLRQELGSLTGSEWRRIRARFDPAVFLDRLENSND